MDKNSQRNGNFIDLSFFTVCFFFAGICRSLPPGSAIYNPPHGTISRSLILLFFSLSLPRPTGSGVPRERIIAIGSMVSHSALLLRSIPSFPQISFKISPQTTHDTISVNTTPTGNYYYAHLPSSSLLCSMFPRMTATTTRGGL
jgi:hypothetical protein